MTTNQLEGLSPAMREAVEFIQWWNLSNGLTEFLTVMNREPTEDNKNWAKAKAIKFRQNGVNLRDLRYSEKPADELDYAVLQVFGERAMAELGRRKAEADEITRDIFQMNEEAKRIVGELRKFKDRAVIYELGKTDAG